MRATLSNTTLMRTAVFLCLLPCAIVAPRPSHAEPYSAWQEIVLLTIAKVQHAASHCGFQSDGNQLNALLASAAIDRTDLGQHQASPSLTRQMAADEDAYGGDANAACSQAWDRFGPDGAPGVRDLLRK